MSNILIWNDDKHVLGNPQLDDTHREFAELVNSAWNEPDKHQFQALFQRLLDHTQLHFANEDALMIASGFPAINEHRAEHDRVLAQMSQFNQRVQRGIVMFGRELVQSLPAWFDLHAATMDSALAAHLQSRGYTD